MKSPSFHEFEQLSAYLDGQISPAERIRLEARIKSDPDVAAALEELRQTRALLRQVPHQRAPRNFTLTPKMAGLRPPVPRLVPALSWASAAAMLLFLFTLGTSLIGQTASQSAAPMMAAAPRAYGGGAPVAAPATLAPATAAPATEPPATANAEAFAASTSEGMSPSTNGVIQSTLSPKTAHRPLTPWLYLLLGIAVLLGISAAFLRWSNKRAFQRRNRTEEHPQK